MTNSKHIVDSNKIKKGLFRKEFIKFYEILSIIFLALFANLISGECINRMTTYKFIQYVSIFGAALLIYSIYSDLQAKWDNDVRASDAIERYSKSFSIKQRRILRLKLIVAVILWAISLLAIFL